MPNTENCEFCFFKQQQQKKCNLFNFGSGVQSHYCLLREQGSAMEHCVDRGKKLCFKVSSLKSSPHIFWHT